MQNDFVSVIKPKEGKGADAPEGVRAIPVLPVRDTVLFPHAVLPLTVGRESSIQLIQSLGEDKTILVVAQRDARQDAPGAADLYSVGTKATVHKVVKMPNQSLFVFTEGNERVRIGEFTQLSPFLMAESDQIPEGAAEDTAETEALQRNVVGQFQTIVTSSPTLSDDLQTIAINIEEPGRLADFIAAIDSDPALQGKITYRCMKNRDGSDYYHLATAADDARPSGRSSVRRASVPSRGRARPGRAPAKSPGRRSGIPAARPHRAPPATGPRPAGRAGRRARWRCRRSPPPPAAGCPDPG